MRYRELLLIAIMATVGSVFRAANANEANVDATFETEVAPLLIKRCVECHLGRHPSGNLLLTTAEGFRKGGDSGPIIDRENPDDSYLLQRIHDGQMPPEKKGLSQKLADNEVAVLRRWIADGAKWPEGRVLDLFERTSDVRGGRDLWSLQPVKRPDVPQLDSTPQPANPIDAFVGTRLEQQQMKPAAAADKRVLLRRLYFDLIGLPPTQAQVETFERDESPQAWDDIIDQLLNSPQYGERWGRYWLDLVRYADTSGYERDQEKPFAWKYRDWVVAALNSDMPYDRFVVQQLAGDELPNRTEASVVATGFLRLGTWNDEPNDPLDYQYDRLEDLVHTTSSSFLAMTVKCARCHDHKFDAIKHEDYYRMASAFWAGPIAARERELLGGPNADELGGTEILGWTDLGPNPPPLHVLKNGEREVPLDEVVPASLSMIPALERTFDPPPDGSKTSHRRLQMAEWIASPDNPLTARVFVNRLWQHHFGKAIVRSPNNFGFLADPPTHPELLDWLADEFVKGGWKIKRMHKLILTSMTWQQSSTHAEFSDYNQKDSTNRLWWKSERRRLDAEALRDTMLAVTGELDLQVGGPGFRPTIDAAALEGLSQKSAAWNPSPAEQQLRRSVYMFSKRGLLPPMMTAFNFSDATQSCGKRDVTTVPTQALVLMNNPFVHGRSSKLAASIIANTDQTQLRVTQLWSAVYGRKPTAAESVLAQQHLETQLERFQQLPATSAQESPSTSDEALALASLAHVLLNSNEFIYVD
ncbi:MAG: PSD1 and planctomycete cytochrome C domain-containing protein [Fuerstiella sp.]